jgi:hypothetical protein
VLSRADRGPLGHARDDLLADFLGETPLQIRHLLRKAPFLLTMLQ